MQMEYCERGSLAGLRRQLDTCFSEAALWTIIRAVAAVCAIVAVTVRVHVHVHAGADVIRTGSYLCVPSYLCGMSLCPSVAMSHCLCVPVRLLPYRRHDGLECTGARKFTMR